MLAPCTTAETRFDYSTIYRISRAWALSSCPAGPASG